MSLSQRNVAQVDGGVLPSVTTHSALYCVPCLEGRNMDNIYLLGKPGFNGDETGYRAQCFNLPILRMLPYYC